MSLLKIKSFGPIKNGYSKEDGFIKITPVTVICGDQATGKSTIAKLYSTCVWLEKKFDAGELSKTITKTYFKELLAYHKIDSYLKKETIIEYVGDTCKFIYMDSKPKISAIKDSDYVCPKIVYIPAERNFCSSIPNASSLKGLAKDTYDFLSDYITAAGSLKNTKYKLPLNGYEYRFDEKTNASFIGDNSQGYEINIINASSGLQALSPMALTSAYYSHLIDDASSSRNDFSLNQEKRWKEEMAKIDSQLLLNDAITQYKKKTNNSFKVKPKIDADIYNRFIRIMNSRFINVVEEPEQNLFPKSQAAVLHYLLKCFNAQAYNATEKIENQLLITTHSPYILSFLTISAKAAELIERGVPADKIEKIIPASAAVLGEKISVYETKSDGSIDWVKPYKNLPSDDNELNKLLEETNEDFSKLLELDERFCK